MVVFTDGKPDRREYRKYKIKTVTGPDDYETMREVIRRRYERVLKDGLDRPDLIIVDGGKGQIAAALDVLENELGLYIPVCGLVKDIKHKTAQLMRGDPAEIIPLPRDSQEFYLLQRSRNIPSPPPHSSCRRPIAAAHWLDAPNGAPPSHLVSARSGLVAIRCPGSPVGSHAQQNPDFTLWQAIRSGSRRVGVYLRSPALGARLLCRRLSMSRSKLYRLMDAEGGVARFIQRQRLFEAYALLSDQSVNRSITALAEEASLCRHGELQPRVSTGIWHPPQRRPGHLAHRTKAARAPCLCEQRAGQQSAQSVACPLVIGGRPTHQFTPHGVGGITTSLKLFWRQVGRVAKPLPPPPRGDDP